MYTYAWYHWITFFFLYSFLGWVCESTFVSLTSRHFVNRGFLRLPLLPIYGTGAVMLLWLSLPVKDSPVMVFVVGVVGATALEFVTGWVMERLFKVRYWDYSKQPFNVKGYICLSASITWGFLALLLTEVVHQPIAEFVLGLSPKVEIPLIVVVGVLFVVDVVFSVKEALDLGRILEAMTRIKAELDELQVQSALLKGEIEKRVDELREDAAARAADARADAAVRRADAAARAADVRADVAARAADARADAAARAADARADAAVRRADAAARAADAAARKADAVARTADAKASIQQEYRRGDDALQSRLQSLSEKGRILKEKRHALAGRLNSFHKSLLRGNPSASSSRFAEALKELRDSMKDQD